MAQDEGEHHFARRLVLPAYELVDVRINEGDIVIDAGSWIGDFAAYASAKGARVYAFEPFDENYSILAQTATLNAGITPIKKVHLGV